MNDKNKMENPYVPRGDCAVPMDPATPRGCPFGYEPYVHRTKKMLEAGDTFDPCCKPTGCAPKDYECQRKIDNRWTARVIRFADTAQYLSTMLTRDLAKIEQVTKANEAQLTKYFQENKDLHESAVVLLEELHYISSIIRRDLDRCVEIMLTVVDGSASVAKAAVMPIGMDFDAMRAETVGSGCGSLESLLAIARTEYYARYQRVAELLNDAISGYRRTEIVRRYRQAKYGVQRLWIAATAKISALSISARQLNMKTASFWLLTGLPFLYTSILTVGTAVPAILKAKDQFGMLMRSLKLFCNFTSLPGLAVGLGMALMNKIHVYFKHRQNAQRIDDEVSKGAVTFFTVVEKFVKANPVAASAVAAMGAARAGGQAVAQTAKMAAQTIASLGNDAESSFLVTVMHHIVLFFMTIMSSTIWKAIGFACKTTAKVAAPVAEGAGNLLSGTASFVGGLTHLVSESVGLLGTVTGMGLGKTGEGLQYLGDQVTAFNNYISGDAELRQNLLDADALVEGRLLSLNEGLNNLLGSAVEGVYDTSTGLLNTVFDPAKVKAVMSLLRLFSTEITIVMAVMAVGYGTMTFFQPISDPDKGLSTIVAEVPDVDWSTREPSQYIKKYGRIIPRPPINFVFQQCLREDIDRVPLCRQRAYEWTGQEPPQEEEDELPTYQASTTRRGAGRRGSRRR